MNSTKRQKDIALEDEAPRLEGVQYATGKSRGQLVIAVVRMKQLDQSRNFFLSAQLWMCMVLKVKFDAVKNIVFEPEIL